jgi:hypothetical protein
MTKLSEINNYLDFLISIDKRFKIKDLNVFNENFKLLNEELSKTKDINKKKDLLLLFLYLNTEKKDFKK